MTLPAPDAISARRGQDRLVVARRSSVPLVQIRALLLGSGGATAQVAAGCLLRRPQVRERLDAVGATAEVIARADGLLLSACAEPPHAQAVVDLLLDLLRPTLEPPLQVVGSEAARLSSVAAMSVSDPGEMTRRAALSAAFGPSSPYAEHHDGDVATVTPDDVRRWHADAGPVVLTVCGDVDPGAAWGDSDDVTGAPPRAPAADAPRPFRWSVRDRPRSAQTTLRAVAPVVSHGADGRAAVEVLQRLLGGGKGSRLVRELRERRGFGYHPGTSIVDLAATSYVLLEADVATEVTVDAVTVVDEVLASVGTHPPSDEELEQGRRGVAGDLARALDAQGSLAELLLALAVAGVAPAGVMVLSAQVEAVTRQAVLAAANDLLSGLHGAATADVAALRGQALPPSWPAVG